MRGLAVAITCVCALAACDIPQDIRIDTVCTIVCECFEDPAPDEQEECRLECTEELPDISDDCYECVTLHREQCGVLDDACEDACDPPEPPPEP